jgi:hypothetical protein
MFASLFMPLKAWFCEFEKNGRSPTFDELDQLQTRGSVCMSGFADDSLLYIDVPPFYSCL